MNKLDYYDNPSVNAIKRLIGIAYHFTIIVIPIVVISLQLFLDIKQREFSPIITTMSKHAHGDYGIFEVAAIYLLSAYVFLLALKILLVSKKDRLTISGVIVMAFMALCLLLAAILPARAPSDPITVKTIVHFLAACATFSLFPVACLLLARAVRTKTTGDSIYIYTLITVGLGMLMNLIGFYSLITGTPIMGIVERIVLINSLLWLEFVSIKIVFGCC